MPRPSTTCVSRADPILGPPDEVLLQQVVGDRGLDFDAGKQRIERRGDDLARSERGGADEHNLVLEACRRASGRSARRPPRRTGTSVSGASIAQQQIALAVERHVRLSSSNDAALTLTTRRLMSCVPVAAMTAASASPG